MWFFFVCSDDISSGPISACEWQVVCTVLVLTRFHKSSDKTKIQMHVLGILGGMQIFFFLMLTAWSVNGIS